MTARKNQYEPEDRLDRCRRLYRKQEDGLSCRALIYAHMEQEGVSESTAWRDWDQVKEWNQSDWGKERDSIVSRLTSLRFRAIEKCMRKGQLQTAAILMAQLGACVQETEANPGAEDTINLNITIEE
jgi:hypothetical protein